MKLRAVFLWPMLLLLLTACPGGGGSPNFTLSVAPSSFNLLAGTNTTAVVSVVRSNFNGEITLGLTGGPAGVGHSFSPVVIPAGSNQSTLSLSVAASTPGGTYTLTVTATGGSITRVATLTLNVTPSSPSDFSLSLSPPTRSIAQGSSGSVTVNINRSNFLEPVALSATGAPLGTTAVLTPNSVPGDQSVATLTINVSPGAPVGNYSLTVIGAGGSLSRSVNLALTITPFVPITGVWDSSVWDAAQWGP